MGAGTGRRKHASSCGILEVAIVNWKSGKALNSQGLSPEMTTPRKVNLLSPNTHSTTNWKPSIQIAKPVEHNLIQTMLPMIYNFNAILLNIGTPEGVF